MARAGHHFPAGEEEEEDASIRSAAELIFQLAAPSWPSCAAALRSSRAGWRSGCPCASPTEQCWSHHLWLTGPAWLEGMQGFWDKVRGSALSLGAWSDAPLSPVAWSSVFLLHVLVFLWVLMGSRARNMGSGFCKPTGAQRDATSHTSNERSGHCWSVFGMDVVPARGRTLADADDRL